MPQLLNVWDLTKLIDAPNLSGKQYHMKLSIPEQPVVTALVTALLLFVGVSVANAEQTSDKDGIGFETVEQVFDAMEADQNAARTDYGGWIIYNIANQGSYTLWSITPEDHPANPSAIRRDVVSKDGEVYIQMKALCQAEKTACDDLIAEFRQINADIKRRMKGSDNG